MPAELFEEFDLVVHAGSFLQKYRTSGGRGVGQCPLHDDTRPSLSVTRRSWRCFGCGATGRILDFFTKVAGMSEHEALQFVKDQRSQQGHSPAPSAEASAAGVETRVRRAQNNLEEALPYLTERGIAESVARDWGLGALNGRLIIPYHDAVGELVGTAERALQGQEPKYRFTTGMRKSNLLFGLDRVHSDERLAVCEGFFDCIALNENGVPAVALGGVDLSEVQVGLLSGHEIIVAMDGDEAGRRAAHRILEQLHSAGISAVIVDPGDDLDPDERTRRDGNAEWMDFWQVIATAPTSLVGANVAGPKGKPIEAGLSGGPASQLSRELPVSIGLVPPPIESNAEAHAAFVRWLRDRVDQLLQENRLQELRCDDLGNAKRLLHMYGERLLYCHEWKKWLTWDGGRWAPGELDVERMGKAVQPMLLLEAAATEGSRREELTRGVARAGSARTIQGMIHCARSEVAVTPDRLDALPYHLNFTNGTLDLRTGILHAAKPGDLLTKQVPHPFNPNAAAPCFLKFLAEIQLGDLGMLAFLQRALGSSLLGVVRDHKLFLCIGRGRNGKGTLCRALQCALGGDYCMEAAPRLLLRRYGEPHTTEVAELKGMRLVTCQEIGRGKELDEELVKRLTGGDRLRARRLYQDNTEFEPSHTLFVFANHRPEIQEAGPAMWRRVAVIPFPFEVTEEAMDLTLGEKLEGEAAGILAWLVAGCLDYQCIGLKPPAKVTEATADYERDSDSVGAFLAECCHFYPAITTGTGARELHDAYEEWCQANNYAALRPRAFKAELEGRGYKQKETKKRREWVGLLVEGGG